MKPPSILQVLPFRVGNVLEKQHKISVFIGEIGNVCSEEESTCTNSIRSILAVITSNSKHYEGLIVRSCTKISRLVLVACWWRVGSKILCWFEGMHGRPKETYHNWTIREINILKKLAERVTTKEAARQLGVPHFSIKNACHRYGIKFERRNYFKKGMKPWNKGKRHDVGQQTRFKKGQLPHNTKFDGCIRVQPDKSGRSYKYIRLSLGNWIPLHRHIWSLVHGDPGENIIRFKDGNTMNCDIDNLMLISRGQNAVLNVINRKPRKKRQLIAY